MVASTIALARGAGSSRLEDARADEHAVGAELHHERGVGGRGDAAGGEVDDRAACRSRRTHLTSSTRRAQVLGRGVQLFVAQRAEPADLAVDRAHVADGLDDVAGAGLALGADHRGALGDAAQRLAQVAAAADEGHRERATCRCGAPRRPASAPRTRRCSRPRAPAGSAPRRSGRCGALAITGMVTAAWISRILVGSAMRATPPCARMSAGTRSSAMTAQAPASSAILACSAVVTSMITPPLSISARPLLTRMVPISLISLDSTRANRAGAGFGLIISPLGASASGYHVRRAPYCRRRRISKQRLRLERAK